MRRDLERLSRETFDLFVIGGGITGACIARDAALRGLSVALVEKNDFAHATSAHNSKLIHGGLRYLRNLELSLVRESLKERRIWQRTAPHIVQPLAFLVPVYDGGWRGRATLAAGLTLYDLLSFDRGWLDDPAQRLPGHRWIDAGVALAREPRLEGPGLDGAFLYSDAQMYAPERLAFECVLDASLQGSATANHLEAQDLLLREGRVEGATVRDGLSDAQFDIRAKLTIVAAGPWADIFLSRALGGGSHHKLVRSKGIHLIVPAMTRGDALTVATKHGHFFVLPWRGYSLVGTTDTAFAGSPDSVGVTEEDIDTFLSFVNSHLPAAELARADVRHFYAGLRPLVDDGSGDTYSASRRAELIDHSESDKIEGLVSVTGGKWTTSRELAERTIDLHLAKTGVSARRCTTTHATLPGGSISRIDNFMRETRAAHRNIAGIDHLARLYGTRVAEILALARSQPGLSTPIGTTGDIAAQIVHAAREEMACTLEDAVLRRTGIGQLGDPGPDALENAASLMAIELGWSVAQKRAEVAAVAPAFRIARPQV
ncbi:MAG: glycerol-3-phosphate dehydrogenase/oxidase [Rhizomicrobium sp.]|jgi:glycerol-3-phosphate dehydrogenase